MATKLEIRTEAIALAQNLLLDPSCIVLDVETTGVGRFSELLQLGVTETQGNEIFNRYFQPIAPLRDNEATAKNGITQSVLDANNAKPFAESKKEVQELLDGKIVVAYNKSFDFNQLSQAGVILDKTKWVCAMELRQKIEGGAKQKLGGNHTALGDCEALVALLQSWVDPHLSDDFTYQSLQAAIDRLCEVSKCRLDLEKEEAQLKDYVSSAQKRLNTPPVFCSSSGSSRVELSLSVSGIKRADGVRWEDLPEGFVNYEPKINATSKVVKDACISGEVDHLVTFEVKDIVKILKNKKA